MSVPNTYDVRFRPFFHRDIEQMSVGKFDDKYRGRKKFIKPYANNKDFDGRVVEDIREFELYGVPIPTLDTQIYCCDPVQFLSEVRLLVGNGKLYGHGHICKHNLGHYLDDNTLIKNILLAAENSYVCVDIGYIYDPNVHSFRWIIIEINPPFSLDDHAIPFEDYIRFCIDACQWIRAFMENSK